VALDRCRFTVCALSFVLVQCGKEPNAGMLAANSQAATQVAAGDSFEDRFPKPQFNDRFPTASESLVQRQVALAPPQRKVRTEPVRVASLTPTLTLPQATQREELTALVSMKSSASLFPVRQSARMRRSSTSPRATASHRSHGGRVYSRTRPATTAALRTSRELRCPQAGRDVVFFHGNGATLERDVRDRQLVPQQTDSGVNAALLAPQPRRERRRSSRQVLAARRSSVSWMNGNPSPADR
jgi:hypothetical protein